MRILITGTSSGIGLFLARQCINRGDQVWVLARRSQDSLWADSTLGGRVRPYFLTADVTSPDQCKKASTVLSKSGNLDAIIHCAGMQGKIGPFLSLNSADWAETILGNLGGTVNVLHAFHSCLRERVPENPVKVICLSGGGATQARPHFSAYAAAKTAIVRLVETLAQEWAAEGIDINALAPGALPTAMTRQTLNAGIALAGEKEIADALRILDHGDASWNKLWKMVAHLLSPASNGVSGRLVSAQWDPVETLTAVSLVNSGKDACFLRRITPTCSA